MNTWVVIAQGLLAGGALAAVVSPLFSRQEPQGLSPTGPGVLGAERENLLVEKQMAYDAIKELELDWRSGKLSEEDYRTIRAELEAEAIEVMKKLDSMESPQEEVQETERNYCSSCGEKIDGEHSFCHSCGKKLD